MGNVDVDVKATYTRTPPKCKMNIPLLMFNNNLHCFLYQGYTFIEAYPIVDHLLGRYLAIVSTHFY